MSIGEASSKGERDGRDCALLGRIVHNPYPEGTQENEVYQAAWEEGYEQEMLEEENLKQ